ncbi:alpha/beta fold hydrolase [Brumimicrobium sp.]|uniref:alpha/beta fold hydrolase n=1 Tax=Brumimicrobium sp. TaxID=2029867 RepID=UPI003A93BE34
MNKNLNTLNYRIVGEGYPVVFLHGFLESNAMWRKVIQGLPNIKAICIELPGHGESILPKEDLSLELITQWVKITLEHIGIEKFSIVGHSLGGYTALHLAEDEHLKLNQVVLLHSHPWADPLAKKSDRNRVAKIVQYSKILFLKEAIPRLYHKPERFETQINHLIEDAYNMDEEAIVQTLYAMRDREDKTEVLKILGKKAHVIQGEFDPLIDAGDMLKTAEKTGVNYRLITDIGHMGHDESTDEVVTLLNQILEQQSYK